MSNKLDSTEQIIARTCHLCGTRHEGKTEDLPEGWQLLKGFRLQNERGREDQQHFAINVCAGCADYKGREGILATIKRWIAKSAALRENRTGVVGHG